MSFKTAAIEFRTIDLERITADEDHPRRQFDEVGLKRLADSISTIGLIQPIVVRPADGDGRYRLLVGERRLRAARLAGEATIPALVHACSPDEALQIQVFENFAQGMRLPLAPREMAHALKRIARGFESAEEAAEHFGQPTSWLEQKTAPANLSPKVEALLESGRITSCTTAVQLDKLAQKNEARLDALVSQLEPDEKLQKQAIDSALVAEGVKRSRKPKGDARGETETTTPDQPAPNVAAGAIATPPATHAALEPQPRNARMRVVAELLGLDTEDEALVLDRLIDEFLALKGETSPPF
jgi:ParB family chromosome partitioning protein